VIFRKNTLKNRDLSPLEVTAFLDKDERDRRLEDYRKTCKHVVKFSTVEFVPGPAEGEILLDSKGRVVYRTLWCVAYGGNR
jgi:hypothetical protein